MIYLGDENLINIGVNWEETIQCIREAVFVYGKNDFAQPLKPYLRYREMKNRIIAMPAYIGGNFNVAGIKWIASFPNNIKINKKRAHSVVVINDANTGEPVGIINSARLSCIRTASVTGLIIDEYLKVMPRKNINLGIIGWGPIGQHHFNMCQSLIGDRLSKFFLYDKRQISEDPQLIRDEQKVSITSSWEEVYINADILITCTVSDKPYIDLRPKKGALLLNISLRDYTEYIYQFVKNTIIVDDWLEVCRENTDVETFHLKKGLQENDVSTIVDVVCKGCISQYSKDDNIMFNPMGMAIFDIATAKYYMNKALVCQVGKILE